MDKMRDLGYGKGASWEASEDALTIWNTKGNIPIIVLSSDQMNELERFWHDGDCPVCLSKIPEGDVICDDCLRRATAARR